MRKNVFLPNGNNKSTFQPEGAAPAASSLKSNYIKNEEKLSKERGTLKNIQNSYGLLKCLLGMKTILIELHDSFFVFLSIRMKVIMATDQ